MVGMDFPVDTHHLDKPKKSKVKSKSKTKHKNRASAFFNGIQTFAQHMINTTEQWWQSSNQNLTQSPAPNNITQQIVNTSENNSMTSSEESDISADILNLSLTNVKNDLLRKKLFLTEEECPIIYQDIKERLTKFKADMAQYEKGQIKKPKYVHELILQLSHDGLALLSHLYAQKDGSCKQPIVVKTFEGFEKIVTFIDDSPNDISVTLIVQFDKGLEPFMGKDFHRVAMRLEKINSEIHAIYLESAVASNTFALSTLKLNQFINENALRNTKEKTIFHVHLNKLENEIARQNDKFQCTVFATKDARELNRYNNSIDLFKDLGIENSSKDGPVDDYNLPPKYFKGVQSRVVQKSILATFGDEVVTRKGLTLKAVYLKHPDQSYIPHFSKKYETLVMHCANSLTDNALNEAINNYCAETITPQRLQAIYGGAKKA